MCFSSTIKKLVTFFGYDIHKHIDVNLFPWLRGFNIGTVIDIGANEGQFANAIRAQLPCAFIHSFEPVKNCFEILSQNFADDNKFRAYNVGLGESDMQSLITVSPFTQASSLLQMTDLHGQAFPNTQGGKEEVVSIRRLDDVFDPSCIEKDLLIKVDVQGYEGQVILGGINTFKKARIVLIETCFDTIYENQSLFSDLYKQLIDLGFVYAGHEGGKRNPFTGRWMFEDSLFIRL